MNGVAPVKDLNGTTAASYSVLLNTARLKGAFASDTASRTKILYKLENALRAREYVAEYETTTYASLSALLTLLTASSSDSNADSFSITVKKIDGQAVDKDPNGTVATSFSQSIQTNDVVLAWNSSTANQVNIVVKIEGAQDRTQQYVVYETDTYATIDAMITDIVPVTYTSQTGITAFATGGQGSATQLSASFNEVTTAATAGDSVKLPAAKAGLRVVVKNDGASAIDVFPYTGDTINDGAANAAIRVEVGSIVSFYAISATNWESNDQVGEAANFLAGSGAVGAPGYSFIADPTSGFYRISATQYGFSVGGTLVAVLDDDGIVTNILKELIVGNGISADGYFQVKTDDSVTAFATGGQGSATQLDSERNIIDVCATAGDSVKLPDNLIGRRIFIRNEGAASCDVFPATGASIGGLAANAAIKLDINQEVELYCDSSSNWRIVGGLLPLIVHTGAGAISTLYKTTHIVTTGADALTLADGFEGQVISLVMITDGGDGVVTPTNLAGADSTITFANVGELAVLIFLGGTWNVIKATATVA